jgi:hypothetical protein
VFRFFLSESVISGAIIDLGGVLVLVDGLHGHEPLAGIGQCDRNRTSVEVKDRRRIERVAIEPDDGLLVNGRWFPRAEKKKFEKTDVVLLVSARITPITFSLALQKRQREVEELDTEWLYAPPEDAGSGSGQQRIASRRGIRSRSGGREVGKGPQCADRKHGAGLPAEVGGRNRGGCPAS